LHASEVKSIEEVEAQLTRRLNEVPRRTDRFGWLLVWSVVCRGELAWQLHLPAVLERLLERLRETATHEGRWTVRIEAEPCEVPAEWSEEDTVLGDFLRAVERYQQGPEAWEGLAGFLPDGPNREELLRELRSLDDQQRQRIWRCVASWGADLLRGETDMEKATATL
jgi:hypothetical protein